MNGMIVDYQHHRGRPAGGIAHFLMFPFLSLSLSPSILRTPFLIPHSPFLISPFPLFHFPLSTFLFPLSLSQGYAVSLLRQPFRHAFGTPAAPRARRAEFIPIWYLGISPLDFSPSSLGPARYGLGSGSAVDRLETLPAQKENLLIHRPSLHVPLPLLLHPIHLVSFFSTLSSPFIHQNFLAGKMKFLLLSLLPLAVELASARPALQDETAALTRRSSPPPPPEELLQRPEGTDSDKVAQTPSSTSEFSNAPGDDYSHELGVKFASDAAGRFLGLGEDDVADLESMFTDDKAIDVAIRPGSKLPDPYDFSTAFWNEESPDVALFNNDDSLIEDKGTEKTDPKSFETYAPPFPLPGAAPTFDSKDLDIFDAAGLPSKVTFDPNNYKLKLDLPAPATSPSPQTDYSLFLTTPPPPAPQ